MIFSVNGGAEFIDLKVHEVLLIGTQLMNRETATNAIIVLQSS